MIRVEQLSKHFEVHEREPGFAASLRSLFHRKYRTVKAVENISFHIPEGQIVGFLGPNGAGKTTTMKMLTGLLHPTSGTIKVAGYVPWEHKNAFKRRISLVMGQKSQLIWDVPAAESFLVNKAIYEIPDAEYKQTLEQLTSMLELEDVIKKPVRQLSLGERMKCELAASLLHKPDILFLDEPTIGLDVKMQEAMRRFVQQYNQAYKATILLTSHYMGDVTALCERVMVIGRGQLLYDGGMTELIDRYSRKKRVILQLSPELASEELKRRMEQAILELELSAEAALAEFPKVILEVPREQVSSVSAALLGRFPVIDLTIEEPSMESIIGRAYTAEAEDSSVRVRPS
ncbi:ATP-binding cassette domain-containing protein [Paenibacillus sp. GD4]|uniref:ABC transporter ATP-binding protein n=1 Tax=Paenibacillus sp. GD4 TaxID=3068890 RepID=UPI0027966E3B|nr:ATP-binding cassette domain-containing protein [Paenibacillus sp. GD4]MDQ1909758.1 ATP-binding cassette domain-containing protein [Paenibacillus sp. GD4]